MSDLAARRHLALADDLTRVEKSHRAAGRAIRGCRIRGRGGCAGGKGKIRRQSGGRPGEQEVLPRPVCGVKAVGAVPSEVVPRLIGTGASADDEVERIVEGALDARRCSGFGEGIRRPRSDRRVQG